MAEDQSVDEVLTDVDELLWRNVHPSWLDNGRMTSQAFTPMPKDEGQLSTARSAVVTASDHFAEYTGDLGLTSEGVWAISVGEAGEQSLTCTYDEPSLSQSRRVPRGHTSVDFTGNSSGKARKIGGKLRDQAETRGKQHPA